MALTGLALAILGILAAVLSRQLTNEFASWTPWLIERLIRRAVRSLPPEHHERFEEEWRSHVNDIPGEIGKLVVACGFLSAARRMSSPFAEHDVIRRIVDFAMGVMFLILTSPTIIVAALLLWFDGHGPVLCKEERIGLNGRTFMLFKFRSGSAKSGNSRDGNALRHVTVGEKFLRVTACDELPQLINVLRGDMSIVGRRPRRPEEVAELAKTIPQYLAILGKTVWIVLREGKPFRIIWQSLRRH